MRRALPIILLAAALFTGAASATSRNDSHEKVAQIVAAIQRADYEGDRAAMQRGYDALEPFLDDLDLAPRVRYWRGFAQWRRAINGFNDAVDPKELARDLTTAIEEFKAALDQDPKFVDAKVGVISSLGFLLFARPDDSHKKEAIERIVALTKEATAMAPDNPRLIWVLGPILWNSPPERGGGQDKAIENYKQGLEICSRIRASDDPIGPSWGKPELMMSLAYCYLNGTNKDLAAAERYAREALAVVPYWHYTRDILLPQIVAARAKANGQAAGN